ncbi:ABC transporter substrate-binding protein [Paucibacter sediminis]|uniref:ABC transporter substrate-binding protein n=1 Tax=Paucibacter sediminis TaxID=3019553 RepID=A0AA95NEM4_9BURK|nr:ABC transporter substrate-binding protein [Paucibacter sp. S2-9]WIT13662.1 ABC transporter substrate-binding protein [Paucibacter sp. S2-9]
MIRRRKVLLSSAAAMLALPAAHAQGRDSLVLGMTLEPPGLDPTLGAASAIAEIVHYNVFETLTKIGADGRVSPLLASSWEVSPDLKTYTFRLRPGLRFHNGEPCDAAAVKFSFERAAGEKSANKDKRVFANIALLATPAPDTLVIGLKSIEPDFLFLLGQATAIIVEPKSAAGNATQPVGTGPYQLAQWARGASLTLKAWPGYRNNNNAGAVALKRVQFRFISEPAAQVAALLSGDVDVFPRVAAARSLAQFKAQPQRYQVLVGASRAKTILAINHRKRPLDDVRVRRAIALAIDRQAVIEAAADGYGVPIGSHYVPGALGYVDTTAINPYDPERARALLKEAGVALPLELSLKLPPTPYARQGGEVVAAQLAKVGIRARIENIEWAQWLSGVYANKAFDLTLIAHVEPYDLGNFAKPGYYWGYESAAFNALYQRILNAPREAERAKLLGEAQRLIAQDAVAAYLYQPQWITVAKRGLKGLWTDMPIFANDLAALSWEGTAR